MSLPRYPEYKDSGVEWLGEVPGHWDVRQGRRLYSQKRDSALPNDEQLSATQKYGVLPQRLFMEMEDQKVTLALSGLENFKHVEVDDFVISLRSFQGGIERSKYSGCVSPAYTVLRPVCQIEAVFMAYLLKSAGYIAALQTVTDGIREGKSISYEQFGQIGLPLPPHTEQQTIAAFLDCETGKIDALIAEQKRLVELLAEKRQAVISHAVTKGLNPNAPMKDSGIEWLGEVPAHWDVWLIKRLIHSIEQGWSPQCEGVPVETPNEWGVLKVGCVNGGRFNPAENKTLPGTLEPIASLGIVANDVLVSRANTRELVGSAAVVQEDYPNLMLCDKLYRLKVDVDLCLPEFLVSYLGSVPVRGQIELAATGASSSMLNIGQSTILEIGVPLPTADEQKTIVTFLESETTKFDALTAEANRAIALLQERRSALISAAVTGKIDVRGLHLRDGVL